MDTLPLYAPVALFELPSIVKKYPVLFLDGDDIQPIAIMALFRMDENQDRAHSLECTNSLPGVLQLYPFIFEKMPNQDAGVLIFDRNSQYVLPVSSNPLALPLFLKPGVPSQTLEKIASLAAQVYDGRRRAVAFASALKAAGILMPSELQLSVKGHDNMPLRHLYIINDAAYRALPKDTIYDWLQKGWVDAISLILAAQHHHQRPASDQRGADAKIGA